MATTEAARAGAYELGEQIGAGGFGEVFRAKHPVIGREVAIKVLHAKYSKDAEAVARFVAEARAVNQISHPGIVEIFDFGELPDGRWYCVMELIEGKTLRDVLRERSKLPLPEALPILRGIAEAIDAAHAAGIAHRDLKPDNVFVTAAGVKVIDFGLAKLTREEGVPITETGAVFGTPLYMSPEQCRGKAVTTATDAYSFGVLAYQLLVGEPPFAGEALELALHHLNDPPPPSKLDARVDRVLLALMAKDPAQRPPLLAEAIAAIAGDAALPAKPRGKRRWWIPAAAALALVAGGTAIYARGCVAPADDCTAPEARLAGVWDPPLRDKVGAKFAAAQRPDVAVAWKVLSAELDGYTRRWSDQWIAACHASDRTGDALLYAQRQTCLENALIALRGITSSVADSDAVAFSEGYIGSSLLPVLADCQSTAVLRAQPPAPPAAQRDEVARLVAESERARSDLRTAINARRTELVGPGLERVRAAAKQLDALGVPQAVIPWFWLAHMQIPIAGNDRDKLAEAEQTVAAVIQRATELRNDQWLPLAYAKEVQLLLQRGDAPDKVDAAMERWRAAIERAGRPLRQVADYARARADVQVRRGNFDAARALIPDVEKANEALGEPVLYGRSALELRAQIADNQRVFDESEKIKRQILDSAVAIWGAEHRRAISARGDLYATLANAGRAKEAIAVLEDIMAIDERVHAAAGQQAWAWTEMFTRCAEIGDLPCADDARAHLEALPTDGSWPRAVMDQGFVRGNIEMAAYAAAHAQKAIEKASPSVQLAAYEGEAYVAFMRADYTAISEPAKRAIALAKQLKFPTLADAMLAVAEIKAGGPPRTVVSIPIPTDAPPNDRTMFSAGERMNQGLVWYAAGRWRDAIARFREALAIYHDNHIHTWDVAELEAFYGDALVHAGDAKTALEPLEESLAITNECCHGFHYYIAITEAALAKALVATGGDAARAQQLEDGARTHLARLAAVKQ